jgi:hypothetical protein
VCLTVCMVLGGAELASHSPTIAHRSGDWGGQAAHAALIEYGLQSHT